MRAGKLWSQIEATFKQMDTAGTELECFQALQKQEQYAASHRINSLWKEVKKQKELEQTLQRRYGDLIVEQERIRHLVDEHRKQAQIQEEIAAKNHDMDVETVEPVEGIDASDNTLEVEGNNPREVEDNTTNLIVEKEVKKIDGPIDGAGEADEEIKVINQENGVEETNQADDLLVKPEEGIVDNINGCVRNKTANYLEPETSGSILKEDAENPAEIKDDISNVEKE